MEYKKMKGKTFEHCDGFGYKEKRTLDSTAPTWKTLSFIAETLQSIKGLEELNITYKECECNKCNKAFILVQVNNGLETLASLSYCTRVYIYPST